MKMAQYDQKVGIVLKCKVCDEDIVADGLACHDCGEWLHSKCIPMSLDLFKFWFSTEMQSLTFYCRTCYRGFQDYNSALSRWG